MFCWSVLCSRLRYFVLDRMFLAWGGWFYDEWRGFVLHFVFLFSTGSRCSMVALQRNCSTPKPICLLKLFCFVSLLWRILYQFNGFSGVGCWCFPHLLFVHLIARCYVRLKSQYSEFVVRSCLFRWPRYWGPPPLSGWKVYVMNKLFMHRIADPPLHLPIWVSVVHSPIILSSVSGFLLTFPLLSVAPITKSFLLFNIVFVWCCSSILSWCQWRNLCQGHVYLIWPLFRLLSFG